MGGWQNIDWKMGDEAIAHLPCPKCNLEFILLLLSSLNALLLIPRRTVQVPARQEQRLYHQKFSTT
jgi:hypothetical protein